MAKDFYCKIGSWKDNPVSWCAVSQCAGGLTRLQMRHLEEQGNGNFDWSRMEVSLSSGEARLLAQALLNAAEFQDIEKREQK